MTPRLRNAIEQTYTVFSARVLGDRLEVCHCPSCMSEEMADSILKTPLHELSNEQLSEYTNSAHGWSDQFLCLLPRYMELISQGERPTYLDADSILSRFRYAPEHSLTPSESAALGKWLIALFEETLLGPIPPEELDCAGASQWNPWWTGFGNDVCEIIEIALPTPFDTAKLLQIWDASKDREANLRLASTLIFGIGAQKFLRSRLLTERAQEQAGQWHDWFTLADHTERFSKAFEREADPRAQAVLLAVL